MNKILFEHNNIVFEMINIVFDVNILNLELKFCIKRRVDYKVI